MKGLWISLVFLALLAGCAGRPVAVEDQGRVAREQAERERIERIQRETDAATRRLDEQLKRP